MTCSTRTSIALALTLALAAACGSDTAGDELPDGDFTTGPGAEMGPGDASADDDPSVTMTATTPTDATIGDDSSSTTATTSSETTSPITADESSTNATDPSTDTTDPSTDTTNPTTDTTVTTDETTDTGPVPMCGDGDPDVGDVCLQPPVNYAMGLSPSDIVLGDFDGDGNLDVATSNEDDDSVSVRLGNGDGTFGAENTFAVGTEPVALEVGYFDPGTDDDLAVVNRGSNDVSILLADGAGGFEAATTEVVGTTPVDLGVASVNSLVDTDDDIVVVNQADENYHVLLSNDDGTFTAMGPFNMNVNAPNTLVVQSYNSGDDANADVFVLGGTQYLGSPGDGMGTIDEATQVSGMIAGANFVRASPARIDGGNTWDIAVVEDTGDRVWFLLGNGAADFTELDADVAQDPSDVAAFDIDGDGILDAVVAHRGADSIGVVPFDATFDNPVVFGAGLGPSGIKVADLDGDTSPDVVTSNADGDDISVLLSDP